MVYESRCSSGSGKFKMRDVRKTNKIILLEGTNLYGKVLLNGKELESIEDFNMVLSLIIKAMNNMVY
ncbi:hypothetical protein A6286_06580 [Bacillus wiedmannii]|nr:hypothetical protein A6286_06580 [Bacillus wiedmannii]